jgi:hypothetical protein
MALPLVCLPFYLLSVTTPLPDSLVAFNSYRHRGAPLSAGSEGCLVHTCLTVNLTQRSVVPLYRRHC